MGGMVGSQWLKQNTVLASCSSMKETYFTPIPIASEDGKPFDRRSLLANTKMPSSSRFVIDKEEWQGIKQNIKRRRSQRNLFKRSGSSPRLNIPKDTDDDKPSSKPGEGLLKKRSGSLPNIAALQRGKGSE